MSFTKIKAGKGRGKYPGRAERVFSRRQVTRRARVLDTKTTGADPTGTTMIRRRAHNEIGRYWQQVKSQIRKNLSADVFGLRGNVPSSANAVLYGGSIKLFNAWFERYLGALEVSAFEPIKSAIVMAYNLGTSQAVGKAVQRSEDNPPLPGTDSLIHAAQNELQGIVGAVLQQGNRVFAEGLFSKASPAKVSKSLAMTIDKIGAQRSGLLVGFYTVRANGHGRLDYWQSIGETHVGIIPERISHGHSLQDAPVQLGTVRLTVPQLRRRPKASQIARATAVERRLAKLGKWVNVETAGDSRVCPICEAIAEDGPYLIDAARTLIPAHPRCLPGNALVLPIGKVSAASKREYKGEMIVFRTAAGYSVSCTPNHPILTDRGWVASKFLDLGSNVISDFRSHWVTPINQYDDQMPVGIEEMTEAFSKSWLSNAVPVAATDFHGDGVGSEITIVFSNGFLCGAGNSTPQKKARELSFILRFMKRQLFSSFGSFHKMVGGLFDSFNCSMCRSHLSLALSVAHTRPFDDLLFGRISEVDSFFGQKSTNETSFEPVGFGQSNYGFPKLVGFNDFLLPDRVVSKLSRFYAGHVFNLQTQGECYIAQGVVTHNCRCGFTSVEE